MNRTLSPLVVAGIIFTFVALMHLLRIVYNWDVIIAGQAVPMYASTIGLIVAGVLAIWMFVTASKS
jgi:hypothetical protein